MNQITRNPETGVHYKKPNEQDRTTLLTQILADVIDAVLKGQVDSKMAAALQKHKEDLEGINADMARRKQIIEAVEKKVNLPPQAGGPQAGGK